MAHIFLVLLLVFSGAAQKPASPAPQDALTDFQRRLQDYLDLRNKVQQDAARLKDKATPEEIAENRAVMAAANWPIPTKASAPASATRPSPTSR